MRVLHLSLAAFLNHDLARSKSIFLSRHKSKRGFIVPKSLICFRINYKLSGKFTSLIEIMAALD
jgi:hypothetical protein